MTATETSPVRASHPSARRRRVARAGGLLLLALATSACQLSVAYSPFLDENDNSGGFAQDVERFPDGTIAVSSCTFDSYYWGSALTVVDEEGNGTELFLCGNETSIAIDGSGRIYIAGLGGVEDGDTEGSKILSMDRDGGNQVVEYEGWGSRVAVSPDGEGLFFGRESGSPTGGWAIHRVTGLTTTEVVPGTEGLGATEFVVEDDGTIYGASRGSHQVVKVAAGGARTVVAGTGTGGFSGDGGPAVDAELHDPRGVDLTPDGNLLIADHENDRIRLVGRASGKILTVAGGGTASRIDDGGGGLSTSYAIDGPEAVAADTDAEFFFTTPESHIDYNDNVFHSGLPDD